MTTPITGNITAVFERHSYPFWGSPSPMSQDVTFAVRPRGQSLVAVYNPSRGDYRIKVWLENAGDGVKWLDINGEEVSGFEHIRDNFFQARVSRGALSRVLEGPPVDREEELPPVGEYRDVCVETVFTEDRRRAWGSWQGDVSGFPGWLHAQSIAITPPVSGGNWHAITLKTGLPSAHVDKALVLRINGVWCIGTPVIDQFDANGQGRFAGTFMYLCDPDEMEEIRSYGDGMTAPPMANEPAPPRVRNAIWELRRLVNLPYATDAAWQADCKQLWNGLVGMCSNQGQLDVCESQMHRYARRERHYRGLVERRWAKVPDNPTRPSFVEWVRAEGGKTQEWHESAKLMADTMLSYQQRVYSLQTAVEKASLMYQEALARCEEREAEYADVIPHIHAL